MSSIKPNDFQKTIMKFLSEYNDDISDKVEKVTKEVSNDAFRKVKERSPKKTGKYAGSWLKSVSRKKGYYSCRIRNKEYRLTHLLEFGHEVIYHGRKVKRYNGKPHITTTELEYKEKLVQNLKKEIEKEM